jgi:hypothetical protein
VAHLAGRGQSTLALEYASCYSELWRIVIGGVNREFHIVGWASGGRLFDELSHSGMVSHHRQMRQERSGETARSSLS